MTHDVAILGSGFAGSILAWILARQGMRVVILDRDRHPRFAIGESSTPLADMALLRIAAKHGIGDLAALARYGTWLKACPEVGCGLKRGFSYFHHPAGQPYADTPDHAASLLVAASATDAASDTHWLRADVDAWLFDHARTAGAEAHEGITLDRLGRDDGQWTIEWTGSGPGRTRASVVIDSTGSGGALARAVGLERRDDTLLTRTGSVFSHFTGVGSWDAIRQAAGDGSTVEPFRSDDAAQHHVLDDGWVWILRFRGGLTSVGIVRPTAWATEALNNPERAWGDTLARHEGIHALLATARPVRPLAAVPRMSRLWSRAAGPGWALVPTTCGFVDPLHSTGIAHALSGVERLADMLLAEHHDAATADDGPWAAYGRAVPDEVAWIDRLVSGCYAGLPDFDRFRQACLLFFLATVSAERSIAGGATVAERGFLDARNAPLRTALTAVRDRIAAGESFTPEALRALVGHLDPVGLLDPAHRQRIAHTAATK